MRRPLHGHRAAAIVVGGHDFLLAKSQRLQEVELGVAQLLFGEAQPLSAELLAQRPFIEGKLNVEGLAQGALQPL